MRATLMHNPGAGDEQPSRGELVRLLQDAGYDVAYQSTKADEYEAALEDPGTLVVVAGGDGTVGKVGRRLIGRGIPLGLLPLGTANNIARTLSVIGPPREIVAAWDPSRRVAFDAGLARGPWGERPFLETVGFGLFPSLMSRLAAHPREEPEEPEDKLRRDLRLLQELLCEHGPRECAVRLDGRDLSGSYLMLEAMNIRFMGPNLRLAPEADPGDGLLDVVFVGEGDRESLLGYLAGRLRGEEITLRVPVHRGKRLQVTWQGAGVHIDDEVWPEPEDGGSEEEGAERGDASRELGRIEITLGTAGLEFLAAG